VAVLLSHPQTRILTESELFGVNDLMQSILWACHFLKAEGYKISKIILCQDNKNGKALSSKRMRHIAIWYFFITNRITKEN
jgi:hypothetical protein